MSRRKKILYTLVGILAIVVLGFLAFWGVRRFGANAADDGLSLPYAEKQLLKINENSRPGTPLEGVNNIVIHYVANPGSSAMANRNYFNSLADPAANPTGLGASAHFIVGLKGEVIQCIPVNEVAYANYPRNFDTVSIEVCHPDESGQFSEVTYESLVRLTADLLEYFEMDEKAVIRHFDVSGKACPKYYVEHEEAWEEFLEAVGLALREKGAKE